MAPDAAAPLQAQAGPISLAPAVSKGRSAEKQLLQEIAALEEMENGSSLMLQELLQHRAPGVPLTGAAAHQKQCPLLPLHHSTDFQDRGFNAQTQNAPLRDLRPPHHMFNDCPVIQVDRTHAEEQEPDSLQDGILDYSSVDGSSNFQNCFLESKSSIVLPAFFSEPVSVKRKKGCHTSSRRKTSPLSSEGKAIGASSCLKHATVMSSTQNGSGPRRASSAFMHEKTAHTSVQAHTNKAIPANHFLTERQRREFLNEKYQVLRSLIPNPTKGDRASIVQDAIDYVKELKKLNEDLQGEILNRRIQKRRKVENDELTKIGSLWRLGSRNETQFISDTRNHGININIAHELSRLGTEVEVRISDNEATIKVTQHQPRRTLLDAFVVLDEVDLELLHASGARIGNSDIYMFNVKIPEAGVALAGHIARKLLQRLDNS
ncbi:hypothetical protein KP509_21G089700 [Ceratopteris richardii]|uniref:BHLH domain-containing protein n=1 Tax=Ceratopteris richardii TaxID=49495 RepID=A0A8T2SCB3_CERRI|nr:hypothetical protein KP509_21G089700 [Ceratopteris richardii]